MENLSLEKYTKQTLESKGIILKKSLGQNFLINQNVIDRIVEVANVDENDIVLEIGPGIGALTKSLLKNAKHVIAIEIDKRFISILEDNFSDYDNFTLINEDVLKLDLDQVINDVIKSLGNNEKYNIKVVANLPYYISSQVLIKLIEVNIIEEIYIMLQKELGERFSSKTGTRESSSITYYISYFTDIEKEINISKNNFKPIPKIDSQVLSFKKRPYHKKVVDEKLLFTLIQSGFKQRRKTLLNNIKSFENEYNRSKKEDANTNLSKINSNNIEKALRSLDLKLNIRAEEIDLDQYIKIINLL